MVKELARLIDEASPLDHSHVHGHLLKLHPSVIKGMEAARKQHQQPPKKGKKHKPPHR